MKLSSIVGWVVAAALLSGCVAMPGKSPVAVKELELEKSDRPTRKDWLDGQRVKVVVEGVEARQFPDAEQAQLPSLLSHALMRAVEEAGSEVIDRGLPNAVREEIKNAELQGNSSIGGPAVAHFVAKPGFTRVLVSSVQQQKSLVGKAVGKLMSKNDVPVYDHLLVVEGQVRIYEIPSMHLVDTLQFREEETEENELPHPKNAPARMRALYEKAFSSIREPFKNHVAPRGGVVKRGIREGELVYQVMVGKEHRVEPRSRLRFYSGDAVIAEGAVVGDVASRSAWVRLNDSKSAVALRYGDLGRVVIDESLMGKLKVW